MSFFSELKRRNVFRVTAAYLVASWLLIEVSATLEDTLHLPSWADSLLAYFLILGFPVALFFSWAYEITPEGIRREKDLGEDEASRAQTARKLDWAVIVMVAVAVVFFAMDRFVLEEPAATHVAELEHTAGDMPAEPAPGGQATGAGVESGIPELSIAVLPFVNMSSDPEQEYFSDGLTEELLNLLADIEELKVAARTSSFFYKDKTKEIPFTEIGRQLGVAHLLEGSVRRDGNQIRVTAQLIKVDDGFHLWSETWDRELVSIFAIQDEIAAGVVEQLRIELLGEIPHAAEIDIESWELTQQARFLWKRRGEGDWEKAFELFKRAVELDENNAAAWLGVSPLYIHAAEPADWDMAMHAVQRAMELDPNNAEARARYGLYLGWTGQMEASRKELERALEIDPNDSFSLGIMSGFAAEDGDSDLELEYLRRAVAADPLYVLNLAYLSAALLIRGKLEEAELYALKILDIDPDSDIGLSMLANVRLRQGRGEDALALAKRMSEHPIATADGVLRPEFEVKAYHVMGDRERSDAVLEDYINEFGDDYPKGVAALYSYRDQPDQVFEWLHRAEVAGQLTLWDMRNDAAYRKFHDDPRWPELIARLEAAETETE